MPATVEVAAFRGTIPDGIPVRPPPLAPFPELPEASTRRHLDDEWRVAAAAAADCWWQVVVAAARKIVVVHEATVTLHHDVPLYNMCYSVYWYQYEDAAAAAFCQWQRLPLGRSVGIPWLMGLLAAVLQFSSISPARCSLL